MWEEGNSIALRCLYESGGEEDVFDEINGNVKLLCAHKSGGSFRPMMVSFSVWVSKVALDTIQSEKRFLFMDFHSELSIHVSGYYMGPNAICNSI